MDYSYSPLRSGVVSPTPTQDGEKTQGERKAVTPTGATNEIGGQIIKKATTAARFFFRTPRQSPLR